jgi:transglutaminase-like putative cysteine protease
MPLARAFSLSSILLAAAAFGGLTLGADLSIWMLSLGWAAIALCLAQTLIPPQRAPWLAALRLSPVTWNILLVIAFVAFWIDFLWVSQELLPAGVHFLIVLMVNKLFNLHQRRDFLHLYAVSLMAVLASAAMTVHIWYAPFLLAYLCSGVWTLLLYHLTKERDDRGALTSRTSTGSMQQIEHIRARFFWATNVMVAGAVCLTIAIFFIIPRVGIGFLQKGTGDNLRTSGFTEKVDLGVMGSVKQDPSIVMRVELAEGVPPTNGPLYLRGMAYDRYNGTSWTNSLVNRRNLTEKPQGLFTVRADASRSPAPVSPEIEQHILLEALDISVLFGVPQALTITGDFVTVQSDLMGVMYVPFSPSGRIQYSVRSRAPLVHPADASTTIFHYPEFIRRQYLQLPSLSPAIARLSQDIIRAGRTPHESVLLIKQYLLENYRYSLDMESGRSPHPLEDFLFARKTGYCEHYASAMVVMLRSSGIPARLVTGFLASEWNGFGRYYTVRQRDAHAWVEVYFPNSGWITFDPTPAQAADSTVRWWQSLDSAMDSMRLRWDQFIIQYNAADQLAVIQGVREGGEALRSRFADGSAIRVKSLMTSIREGLSKVAHAGPGQPIVMVLLIGGGLLLLAVVVKTCGATRSGRGPHSTEQMVAAQWYARMLRLTAARGLHKAPADTPLEFARHVEEQWKEGSPHIRRLTQLYCRVRFGQMAISREDRLAAEGLLQELGALKKSRSASEPRL